MTKEFVSGMWSAVSCGLGGGRKRVPGGGFGDGVPDESGGWMGL